MGALNDYRRKKFEKNYVNALPKVLEKCQKFGKEKIKNLEK